MVLIAWMMACLHAVTPTSPAEPMSVALVMTLTAPEAAQDHAVPPEASDAVAEAIARSGGASMRILSGDVIAGAGTHTVQVGRALDAAQGSTVVMIVSTARPRGELAGRYRWEVSAQVTVARTGGEVFTERINLPVNLTYVHEGPEDALKATARQLARRADLAVSRYQRGLQ